jgi:hypothetical protein
MTNGNFKLTARGLERIVYIITIVAMIIGWAISWERSNATDRSQNDKILTNEANILDLERKCDAFGDVTIANSTKIDLLLDYFDIANPYQDENP